MAWQMAIKSGALSSRVPSISNKTARKRIGRVIGYFPCGAGVCFGARPGTSREAGLAVKDIIGLTYNPLSKRYKLEADVDVNYMIQTLKEA